MQINVIKIIKIDFFNPFNLNIFIFQNMSSITKLLESASKETLVEVEQLLKKNRVWDHICSIGAQPTSAKMLVYLISEDTAVLDKDLDEGEVPDCVMWIIKVEKELDIVLDLQKLKSQKVGWKTLAAMFPHLRSIIEDEKLDTQVRYAIVRRVWRIGYDCNV